jgi:hypothetical protein
MTLSRRGLLSALAVGSVGSLAGHNAAALLSDRETMETQMTAGLVDIVVEYWRDLGPDGPDLTAPDGVGDGTTLAGHVEDLSTGAPVRDLFRISLPQDGGGINNPARIWLRADCPEATTLGELLTVTLSYSETDGTAGPTIASGSLRGVADTLREGVPLAESPPVDESGCIADELFVLAEYELAAYVGSESVALPLEIRAVQCRNTDRTLNPFGASDTEPCPPGYSCDCCWMIGKVDVEAELEVGETYSFDEGLAGYGIEVTAMDGDGGVAFTLTTDEETPLLPLCAVDVKGGPEPYEHYPRSADAFGFDTTDLDGTTDGLVYTPVNDNNGTNYGISNIVVSVCAPTLSDGSCPAPLTQLARGGGRP